MSLFLLNIYKFLIYCEKPDPSICHGGKSWGTTCIMTTWSVSVRCPDNGAAFWFGIPSSAVFFTRLHSRNSEFFEAKRWFQTRGGEFPNGPPFFLLPSNSLNQSHFGSPSLKLPTANGFTKYGAVCLKHTQNAKSERFYPILPRFQSEFWEFPPPPENWCKFTSL